MSLAYEPVPVSALPRVTDRLTFLYVERCVVHREDNAVLLKGEQGRVLVPASNLLVFMFGPGCTVSHQAVLLLGQCGSSCVWVGEACTRFYAVGRSLSEGCALLKRQAHAVSHKGERLEVARRMYSMRFSGEDVSGLTMQQLRGREGARMKRIYVDCASRFGVEWSGRSYDPNDFAGGSPVNRALSAANSCLYAVVQAVLLGLGLSPALGFVHDGHERSFVYDIADLYKASVSIPLAFELAAGDGIVDFSVVRRCMRDRMVSSGLVPRIVSDVQSLLSVADADWLEADFLSLWDYQQGSVSGGKNYGAVD